MTVDHKRLEYPPVKGANNHAPIRLSKAPAMPVGLTQCLLFFVLVLAPLYVFESGGFQPVDIPIFAIFVATLLSLKHSQLDRVVSVIIMLLFYVAYAVVVNMAYYVNSAVSFYIKVLLQTLYMFIVFATFSIVFERILVNRRGIMVLYFGIVLSLCTPFFMRGEYDAEKEAISLGWRNALSFNNPNQLAYCCLLIYAMAILLRRRIAQSKLGIGQRNMIGAINFYVLIMVHVLVVYSASRAGVMAILLADVIMILQCKRKLLVGGILFLVAVMFVSLTPGETDKGVSGVEIISKISETDIGKGAAKRISGRFFQSFRGGFAIAYGSGKTIPGEGKREVHNGFIDILLSYGIIGTALFYLFLLFIIIKSLAALRFKEQLFHLLMLVPIVAYNMSHNGFRFRLFWIFLAFWHVITRTYMSDARGKGGVVS
jgi:O-antigen ligase